MTKFLIILIIFVTPILYPQQILSHAFGQLYNLPVPFWLYLYGGAAAIIASFLVIGYFFNKAGVSQNYPRKNLSSIAAKAWFLNLLRLLGFTLFSLTLVAGFIGENSPRLNFNMTFFWVIFVLGFAYAVAVFGNIWAVVNPWKTLAGWFEGLSRKKLSGVISYPKNLYYYPAFVFYLIFIWLELFGRTSPIGLSTVLFAYTLVNAAGILLVGKDVWFTNCEFFSVFFRILGKIAVLEYREGKLYLRPPIVGLLRERAGHFSLVIFILFMLSSTAFDGVKSTLLGVKALTVLESFTGLFFGQNSYLAFQVAGALGILLSPLLFLYLYLMTLVIAKTLAGVKTPLFKLALDFAFTLVPIAFVYNVAHYYTLILTEGQEMVRLISDPFGFRWDLFGTRGFKSNPLIIGASVGWHLQVGVILVGHIAAVYLAHMVALKVFPSQKKALLSQLPMLVLMVLYTMIGLWILAQPIVAPS